VDPEKLEKVLDAQKRGLFWRDENDDDRTAGSTRASSSSFSSSSSGGGGGGFWKRRKNGIVAEETPPPPPPPHHHHHQTIISTWTLPDDNEFDRKHRLAPGHKRETVGKGLALIAAINVALLWAGSRAPTGG